MSVRSPRGGTLLSVIVILSVLQGPECGVTAFLNSLSSSQGLPASLRRIAKTPSPRAAIWSPQAAARTSAGAVASVSGGTGGLVTPSETSASFFAEKGLVSRVWKAVGEWAWVWIPVAFYWILPWLERKALFASNAEVEALVDATCSSVFIPVVGILYAILVGLSIESLWEGHKETVAQMTEECAKAAMLLPKMRKLGPALQKKSVLLLKDHLMDLQNTLEASAQADTKRTEHLVKDLPHALLSLDRLLCEGGEGEDTDSIAEDVKELINMRLSRMQKAVQRLPLVHWMILWGLSVSMLYSFWLVATGPISEGAGTGRVHLSNCASPRIRVMFSVLSFSTTAVFKIIRDLERPLSGVYSIVGDQVPSAPMLNRAIQEASEILGSGA
uniref:Uncharacterized protein n=1 Tax=Chromera velia CCMP2878 TaxID=1169474 RepID=A0A0G4HT01_9ALVE|mmetsp:Transcript_3409/g.7058  ORF Transcript_3409/g.7058 Transcript_3409/m.7058 type:complete len:386 (+) Transcript_3409:132-1289(+)|eukprot:Cvel_8376.t1-p1 / transcript=Cvel_8376.t1 / gene=Cvel_8376 / organism=Chromera_velia_CCMP2878 / gene_product=hypothetical protein / transcript_product=hypothetical protein / location=Cvel_scaffold461:62536-64365(+) / protein_length=385 / sequence_SO=supercontig / SO=protein_coding / is_pseudo=false